MLERLRESGLGAPLGLAAAAGGAGAELWQLGLGPRPPPSPWELLQAARPNGVICYFSAISHHELSTQLPSHHHIAVLRPEPRRSVPPEAAATERIPRLGTRLFDYEGVAYYCTTRSAWMVAGSQRVYLSAAAIARVTTLEQTLLDTLHRPWHCGGPAVVFEAWQRGRERLAEERLRRLLEAIQYPLLTRRTGCMLEQCGHAIADPGLAALLDRARTEAATAPATALLPAVPGRRVNTTWQLELP
jgi:predicted transcriptional regulator of viral defense system